MKNIIEIQNLKYIINKSVLINNINMEIEKGDFVTLIGPNGAGKSTLLELITNMTIKTSGEIKIDDKNIEKYKRKELAKLMSYVPQITIIDYSFTVENVVLMGRIPYLNIFEQYSNSDYELTKKAMQMSNVYELKDRNINTLSGGELQRVLIARAINQQSEIIILDEPINNLDIKQQIEIMEILKQLNKSGITVICVLHDINVAYKYASKVVLINKGEIKQQGEKNTVITTENIKEIFGVNPKIIENKYMIFV